MNDNDIQSLLTPLSALLKKIVGEAVREALEEQQHEVELAPGRLTLSEAEAAARLGVPRHVLRDARLRGEIEGRKIGRRIFYTPAALQDFLQTGRGEEP